MRQDRQDIEITNAAAPRWRWFAAGAIMLAATLDICQTALVMALARRDGMGAVAGEANPVALTLGFHTAAGVLVQRLVTAGIAAGVLFWAAGRREMRLRRIAAVVAVIAIGAYGMFLLASIPGVAGALQANDLWRQASANQHHLCHVLRTLAAAHPAARTKLTGLLHTSGCRQ